MNCVISGSFRKHYDVIREAISDFEKSGITVLSPKKTAITNPGKEFAILESDISDDQKLLERAHLAAIRKCDFLYICNPEGYTGASTLLEIGFAIACSKRIYFMEKLTDSAIASFVSRIASVKDIKKLHATT